MQPIGFTYQQMDGEDETVALFTYADIDVSGNCRNSVIYHNNFIFKEKTKSKDYL